MGNPSISSRYTSYGFIVFFREDNMIVDWIVKLGCIIRSIATLFTSPPARKFSGILTKDIISRTLERRLA